MESVSLKGLVKEDGAPLGKQCPFEDSAAQGPGLGDPSTLARGNTDCPQPCGSSGKSCSLFCSGLSPDSDWGDTAELRISLCAAPTWLVF